MNGMLPPSPNVRAGWPNAAADASSSAAASHGAKDGAFHPGPDIASSKRTVAPDGGSASTARWIASSAAVWSHVGGRRKLRCSEVDGRNTLPACPVDGNPSAPV